MQNVQIYFIPFVAVLRISFYDNNKLLHSQGTEIMIGKAASPLADAQATNLTAITWAHAVNNQTLLTEALNSKYPSRGEILFSHYL